MSKFNIGQWSKDDAARREARRQEQDHIDSLDVKLFGHAVDEDKDLEPVTSLREICIVGSPEVLRAIAKHLLEEADSMERMGEDYDHAHWRGYNAETDIVISRPRDID